MLVELSGQRVAIEAKYAADASHQSATRGAAATVRAAQEAAKDAARRLVAEDAHFAVAVVYPSAARVADLESRDDLRWGHVRLGDEGGPQPVVLTDGGGWAELATWLRWVLLADDQAALARRLETTLSAAANQLADGERVRLIRPLGIGPSDSTDKQHMAAKRMLLMLAAATMFHVRIQQRLEDMPETEYPKLTDTSRGKWRPPQAAGTCRVAPDPVGAFAEAWTLVLDVDYRPIFEAARDALYTMHGTIGFPTALRTVTGEALGLASQTATLRYDLLGGVFHRVLDTARYDGSFYTTAAAATLLAGLAIPDDWLDWSDPDAITSLRICDPACGSGTLLLAALERVERLGVSAGAIPAGSDDRTLVVSSLIEDSLWGYDINSTATHLAATSLGLVAPDVDFRRMCLFHSKFGVYPNGHTSRGKQGYEVHLGSVDLLPTSDAQLEVMRESGVHSQVEIQQATDRAADPPKMDLVIMNPPFTRDSLRHDHLGPGDEKRLKEAEKRLLAAIGTANGGAQAARLHSSDGIFFLLGEHLAATDGGRIAVVLPAVVATSPGAAGRRKFLAQHFHIETIVISHDPDRINFSGNTAISEMLVIGCRRPLGLLPAEDQRPTRLVVLLRNPANMLEAHEMLVALASAIPAERDTHGRFVVYEMPAEQLREGDWRQVAFASDTTHNALLKLEANLPGRADDRQAGEAPRPPACVPLGEVNGRFETASAVGPAGRRTQDAFRRRHVSHISTGKAALWFHKGKTSDDVPNQPITTMAAQPDSWLEVKQGKAGLADTYWSQRSRLLIANRVRWNTMQLVAVRVDTPVLGSAWIPVAARDEDHEKALCVWLNSTLGVLGLYGNQSLKAADYPRFSLDDLRAVPVPQLSAEQSAALAVAFDDHSDSPLRCFTEMRHCEVRRSLDAVVAEVVGDDIGFTSNDIHAVREGLAREPAISRDRG